MIQAVITDSEQRMKKALEHMSGDLSALRAGRANPGMLERISVPYYGQPTAINQLANITVPEARLLVIQPWDKKTLPDIEKAILKSDLGVTPSNDGQVIRLNIPALTEERRKEMVKIIKKYGEECKVAVRNVRREANEQFKKLEKDKKVSEDEAKQGEESAQKATDKFIKEIDQLVAAKEKEIMEI
jgi:ribosome recycling factor